MQSYMEVEIRKANPERYPEIIEVWEASVKATHHFLTEEDIHFFKSKMASEYLPSVDLYVTSLKEGEISAFMGLSPGKIEMLFVRPEYFGQGTGSRLIEFALRDFGIRKVDVNEQNPKALKFYMNRGFHVVSRDEADSSGKPFPILHMAYIKPEIVEYVEREIIPQYQGFDKAHQEDHVRMVIEQSMKLAEHIPALNTDMVYLIAAFHDLGLVNGRENHHADSRKILEANTFIKSRFSEEDVHIMGEAVEDHRASSSHKPRSEYGLIVAEADRFIDPETIIRRTIQYGLSHYPELDSEGHFQRTILHLKEKYGPKGYLKVWVSWSDNAQRLKDLHRLIADEKQIREIFNRIYEEETDGYN